MKDKNEELFPIKGDKEMGQRARLRERVLFTGV